MNNVIFRTKAILLKRQEEFRIGKQCADTFKKSQYLIATFQSRTITEEKLILDKLLNETSLKIENIV